MDTTTSEPPTVPSGGNIYRRLLELAWPVIGLNVLNVLALAVDTAMIGRMDGADQALTGLGFSTQLLFLLMVLMMGLTVGSVAMIARAHGAEQPERVNHILAQSSALTVILSIIVAVLGHLLAEPLLRVLGAGPESAEAGMLYLRVMLTGVVFNYLNILYAAALRGVGETRLPFLISLGMNLLNALFNYGLILGNLGLPALGLRGAAIGTVTAQAIAVFTMVILLRRDVISGVHLSLRPPPIDVGLARSLGRIGAPAALDMVVLNAGFLSIIGMLGRIDDIAVAAHGVGLRIQALAFVPGMSIGQATGAMVGNALGAHHPDEVRRITRAAMVLCAVSMTTLGMIFIIEAESLLGLFDIDHNTPLADYSVMWIRLLGLCMPAVSIYIALNGAFQGAGATRLSLRINILATVLIQIPLSWVLGFPLGMSAFGVWLAFPIALGLKSLMGIVVYRSSGWMKAGDRV
ncbi:MAG: MATE family efflux transporter [Myxococcota bacterium]